MTIPVFYNPKAVSTTGSFSPSGHKPQLVVEQWEKRYKGDIKVMTHGSLGPQDIGRAHDYDYVKGVLLGKTKNGFGTATEDVSRSCLYTCGGIYSAAQHVLDPDTEDLIACAPYSGFHHAGYNFGGGFCTFNGLVAASMSLLETYQINNVLILDCDYHYGNGTQDIIDRSPSDFSAFIRHWSAGEFFQQPQESTAFFEALAEVLKKNKQVDLILYQAGADPHVDDPLGGFLTNKELAIRDKMVFQFARAFDIPLVWNLAGGYQTPVSRVLKIHENTLLQALLLHPT